MLETKQMLTRLWERRASAQALEKCSKIGISTLQPMGQIQYTGRMLHCSVAGRSSRGSRVLVPTGLRPELGHCPEMVFRWAEPLDRLAFRNFPAPLGKMRIPRSPSSQLWLGSSLLLLAWSQE